MKKQMTDFESALETFLNNTGKILSKSQSEGDKVNEFETSQDLHLLDDLGRNLPEETVDRVVLLFSKLSLFFERGILLEKIPNQGFSPQIIFKEGHLMAIDGIHEGLYCQLPQPDSNQVFKLNNLSLLEQIKLKDLGNDSRLTALLFHPVPEFAFLLFSRMPDLWLKDHAGKTLEKIMINLQP